jgi:hypothetical protein
VRASESGYMTKDGRRGLVVLRRFHVIIQEAEDEVECTLPQSPMCHPVMHRINHVRARTACRAAKKSPEVPLGSSHV